MSMVINTNVTALIGQQNLTRSQSALQTAMARLSSGLRINSAADDAAGEAIANRMTAQINGLTQAQRNANDGISVAQTAEGALDQVNDNLQRIRQLMVQANNGTNSQDDLKSIQSEVSQRLEEINRIGAQTTFNGVSVLDSSSAIKIQVGADDGQQISISLAHVNASVLFGDASAASTTAASAAGSTAFAAALGKIFVTSGSGASATLSVSSSALANIDSALNKVDDERSTLGAIQNRFQSAVDNLNTTTTNLSAAQSRIQDADYATEVSNMTRAQILQQAGTSVLAQANQVPQTVLSLLPH